MTVTDAHLAELQTIYPDAELKDEGGTFYVYLPRLPITVGGVRSEIDSLLCPTPHGSYTTRLFLSDKPTNKEIIGGNPANWTAHIILGRTWYSWSWQGVSPTLSFPQMLLAHLSALR